MESIPRTLKRLAVTVLHGRSPVPMLLDLLDFLSAPRLQEIELTAMFDNVPPVSCSLLVAFQKFVLTILASKAIFRT